MSSTNLVIVKSKTLYNVLRDVFRRFAKRRLIGHVEGNYLKGNLCVNIIQMMSL